jgi:hypothetical protein
MSFSLRLGARLFREEIEIRRHGYLGFSDATDAFRRIVATSKWWYPYTLTPEQEAAGVGEDKMPETYPAGAVRELADSFFADLFEKRKRLLDHETQYCMFHLPSPSCSEPVLFAKRIVSCEYSSGKA